jgi:hypothetical protein
MGKPKVIEMKTPIALNNSLVMGTNKGTTPYEIANMKENGWALALFLPDNF